MAKKTTANTDKAAALPTPQSMSGEEHLDFIRERLRLEREARQEEQAATMQLLGPVIEDMLDVLSQSVTRRGSDPCERVWCEVFLAHACHTGPRPPQTTDVDRAARMADAALEQYKKRFQPETVDATFDEDDNLPGPGGAGV